jgi:hypothetical protein
MNKNKNYMKIYRSLAMIYAVGVCGGGLQGMQRQVRIPQFTMRQQVIDGLAYCKTQASAIMSRKYTIPQVYVWGGAIAFTGLAYLYGRQCFSMHDNLFSRGASMKTRQVKKQFVIPKESVDFSVQNQISSQRTLSSASVCPPVQNQAKNQRVISDEDERSLLGDDKIGSQIDQIIKNDRRVSHEDFMQLYPQVKGLSLRFKLLSWHEYLIDNRSFAVMYAKWAANLRDKLASDKNLTIVMSAENTIYYYEKLSRMSDLLGQIVFPTLRVLESMRSR